MAGMFDFTDPRAAAGRRRSERLIQGPDLGRIAELRRRAVPST
jgi:hypothetical protein